MEVSEVKCVYADPSPGFLGNGRPLAFGQEVDLTAKEMEDPTNVVLLQAGKLKPVSTQGEGAAEKAEKAARRTRTTENEGSS